MTEKTNRTFIKILSFWLNEPNKHTNVVRIVTDDKAESDDEAKISAEVLEVDGEKIVIEQQDEADACNNSGTSREDEKGEEDTKTVTGVAKVETEQDDSAGGDVEMKSECSKCHLPQVKDEADNDNNMNRECCKCRLQQVKDESIGNIQKEAEKTDEKQQSDSGDKKKTEELDLEDLMEVEDS